MQQVRAKLFLSEVSVSELKRWAVLVEKKMRASAGPFVIRDDIWTILGDESANERRVANGSDHEVFHRRTGSRFWIRDRPFAHHLIVTERKLCNPFHH